MKVIGKEKRRLSMHFGWLKFFSRVHLIELMEIVTMIIYIYTG